MKYKVAVLFLLLFAVSSCLYAIRVTYETNSSLLFETVSDIPRYPNTTLGAKIGTINVYEEGGYTGTNISVASNFNGKIRVSGWTSWNGSDATLDCYLAFKITKSTGGPVSTTYYNMSGGGNVFLTSLVSGVNYTIGVYVIANQPINIFDLSATYTLKAQSDTPLFDLYYVTAEHDAGRTNPIPINGNLGGSGTEILTDTIIDVPAKPGEIIPTEPDPPEIDPVVELSIDNKNGTLDNKNNTSVADISITGTTIPDNGSIVTVTISQGTTSPEFELVKSQGITIPYILYARVGSSDVQITEDYDIVTNLAKADKDVSKLVTTLKAKINLTDAQLIGKPAGTYTDTVYISIKVD